MKAKKSFGQHFLNNHSIAEEIAQAIHQMPFSKNLLEVGPGQGMLTQYLIRENEHLKVVELDRDMIPILQKKFPKLEIIESDFLKLDLKEIFSGKPFCLVGNYPYNISSQIVFKMLDMHELIPAMVGMFQKEVAERIISPPGSKKFGIISVFTQLYYDGSLLINVDKSEFDPPPNVQSAVILLKRKKDVQEPNNPKLFRSIVKQSFGMRRKMIRKCIKTFIPDHDFISDPMLDLRPEKLSTIDFIDLSNKVDAIIKERNSSKP